MVELVEHLESVDTRSVRVRTIRAEQVDALALYRYAMAVLEYQGRPDGLHQLVFAIQRGG